MSNILYIYIYLNMYIYKELIDPGVWLIIKPIIDVFGGNEDLNHAGVGETWETLAVLNPQTYIPEKSKSVLEEGLHRSNPILLGGSW